METVTFPKDELVAVLEDVLAGIKADDSYEGFINWLLPNPDSDDLYEREAAERRDFMVEIRYRIGNSMGQGGMRILQR